MSKSMFAFILGAANVVHCLQDAAAPAESDIDGLRADFEQLEQDVQKNKDNISTKHTSNQDRISRVNDNLNKERRQKLINI